MVVAVVDDDAEVRLALMRLLASAGIEAESFASGMDFVQSVAQHAPECVVLDLHMPGLSGFDVQQQLVARHPQVAVVIVTGRDTPEARARALHLGASAYLSKPVDGETLLQAIGGALRQHGT